MLSYKDILYSITKTLKKKYKDITVIVKNEEGIFGDENEDNKECFYVKLLPLETTTFSTDSNLKGVIASVKYFGEDQLKRYDVASDLNILFARTLKVKDRVLNISSTEPNFYEDEVGEVLDFLITVKYDESVYVEKEERELIGSVTIRI